MQICEPQPESTPVIQGEILDQFYAPVEFDALTMLVSEFERERARIKEVHSIITQERVSGVMGYFFAGNSSDDHGRYASLRHTNSFDEIFRLAGALNELTATFWSRALSQTDLMDYMPQARRDEWHRSLNEWRKPGYKRGVTLELDMPEFTLDTLRGTVQTLLARRSEFLAERVDGIFRGLSRTHVKNAPEGFGKCMIMAGVYNEWGWTDSSREGVIHDLRLVIAKFMGRDDPSRGSTSQLLKTARAARGKWIEADGGALRVRGYQVGTAHLEVHPEMAYRLNMVLAALYPAVIPESFRTRPKRSKGCAFKTKPLFERPFSNAVGAILAGATQFKKMVKTDSFRNPYDHVAVRNAVALPGQSGDSSKYLKAEVATVMQALGGVLTNCTEHPRITYWQFDFDAMDLVHEVAVLGYIPDQKSHQFYPTPKPVAQQLVDWLDIGLLDTICEPQAGQGAIADLLPKDRTRCVEISPLHCDILRKKGHNVTEGDFLSWNPGGDLFTVIAMNPPFSEGRWQAHLKHAGELLAPMGRLGAVLPLSAKRAAEELLPGFDLEFSNSIDNAFSGTSISVVLLKAIKR